MSNLIIEDLKDSILKITLNNPSEQNTLSLQFINDLKKMLKLNFKILEISVIDKFGDYGIISYMIVKVDKDKFMVTDFILSCRVFKRFIEETIIFFVKKQFGKKTGYI